MTTVNYNPAPTVKRFITSEMRQNWIVGPVGSGKSVGSLFKIAYHASRQAAGPDGIRRSRCVVVRNTMPQLKDTTMATWFAWFKAGIAGQWVAGDSKFILRFGDVECEVLFRPLDSPDDVARVLSLEITYAVIDEFVQIPREIIEALEGRLGRYPRAADGGPTWYGMWGASNPDNADSWWFDYLYSQRTEDKVALFEQPSGLSPEAENTDNLPGKEIYYPELIKGKEERWIKQFVEARWGFSLAGRPVWQAFNIDLHVAKKPLLPNRYLPLVGGFDPGMRSVMLLGQCDLNGRLCILDEIYTEGMGAQRMITERLRPLLRSKYRDFEFIISPDPAANQRTPTDERTVCDVFRKEGYKLWVSPTNLIAPRIDAGNEFVTKLTASGPGLLVDPSCVMTRRALAGGHRYTLTKKHDVAPEPDKNEFSHFGDAFTYLSLFFVYNASREARKTRLKNLGVRTPGNIYVAV